MKRFNVLILFYLFCYVPATRAQTVSTYSILSTAYNRPVGTFHPLGAVDGGWVLIRTQVMSWPLNAATIVPYPNSPTYVVPNAGNNFFPGIISNRSIHWANNTSSTGPLLMTYRTYFTLPNLSATSNRYSLQFKLSADDAVDHVELNGTVKAQFLGPGFTNLPQFPKPYMLTVPVCDPDFVSGQNYIDIVVADAGGAVCFYGEIQLLETTNSVAVSTISALASPGLICAGQTASLTATGATSYTWSTGATGAGAVVSPTTTTTYTVLSSSGGCTGVTSASAIVTVSVSPFPSISATASPTLLCAGESATLTAGGATSYTWNAAGLPSGTTNSVIVVTPGQTTLYTVTGATGPCVNSSTLAVSVLSGIVQVSNVAVCAGYPAMLSASGAYTYSWSNAGTLSSSTGSAVVASPPATQSYTVTGSVGACTSSAVATVSVVRAPVLTAASSTTNICPGTVVTLTAGGASSYTWSPAVTMASPDGSTVTVSPTTTTTYSVTGGTGTCTNTAFVSVSVLPAPALAVQDQTICTGSTATLSASGAASYTWQPGSVNSSSIVVTPGSTQLYTVIGSSASGCRVTTDVLVTVVPPPALSISSTTPALCPGSWATLSASGASSYTWSPGGINTSTLTVFPTATETFTVTGSVSSISGCISTGTITVVVLPAITPIISAKEEICLGQSTKIYASGGSTYQWTPATGIHPVNPVITVSPTATTIYSVTVSSYSTCPATVTVEIVVNPLPLISAGRDTTINMDDVISLNGTGNVPVGFIATTGTPLNCTFCSSIMINPQENTCYTLMGENQYRCIAFDEVCVTVTKDWSVYVPNAFTPNGDGNNDAFLAYGYGILSIDLMIFDRWGELIYKEEDTQTGWNGKRKGTLCEQGIYTYKMAIHIMTGQSTERVGHVTLLPK